MSRLFEVTSFQEFECIISFHDWFFATHGATEETFVFEFCIKRRHVTFLLIFVVPVILPKIISMRLNLTLPLHPRDFSITLAINVFRFHLRDISGISWYVKTGLTVWNGVELMVFITFVFGKVACVTPCWIGWAALNVHVLSWF